MAIARVPFVITGEHGSTMYLEGQEVPDAIAKQYPHFVTGYEPPKQAPHNPNLPLRLSKAAANKLSEDELVQWLQQYHPAQVPSGEAKKPELVEIVMQLQE